MEQTNLSYTYYNFYDLGNGQYYWKVRAKSIGVNWSDWSDTWSFTSNIHRITAISPDNAQQGQSLSVTITGENTHFVQGTGTVTTDVKKAVKALKENNLS